MSEKVCPRCGMEWEPDMDQFGCWNCGYGFDHSSGVVKDEGGGMKSADNCRTPVYVDGIKLPFCWLFSGNRSCAECIKSLEEPCQK